MSKALDIAAERFAKGKITKEEYHEIRDSLMATPQETTPHISLEPEQAKPEPAKASPEQVGLVTDRLIPSRPPPSSRPAAAVSYPTTYYDLDGVTKLLGFFTRGNAAILGFLVFGILRKSGIQAKYDLVFMLDNNPAALVILSIPYLATMVLFLFWKKKSTDNLFLLRGPQSITPAGAVYWYFVPIAWFWKPFEAMRNLAVGFNVKSEEQFLLTLWWGLFWGSIALGILAGLSIPEVITTESQATAYVTWSIVLYAADAIWLLASWALIELVSKAQKNEIRLAQEDG